MRRDARQWVGAAAAAAGLVCGGAPGARGQPPAAEARIIPADQVELVRLVDLCAQRLRVNIEYDPAVLKGAAVTLRLGSGVTDGELWGLTNRLLSGRGLTTVRMAGDAGTISVVKLGDAAGLARIEEEALPAVAGAGLGAGGDRAGAQEGPEGAEQPGDARRPEPPGRAGRAGEPAVQAGFRSVMVRVQSRPAKELADSIKPFLTRQGATQVGVATVVEATGLGPQGGGGAQQAGGGAASAPAAGPGGMLIVSDLSPRLDEALRMLATLDTPAERTVVEERPLLFLSGSQMATLVMQVSGKQGTISGRRVPGEVLASPNGGAVLLLAPESQMQSWRDLVAQLDQREPVEVVNYSPRYFGLKEVANLIEQSIRDDGGAGVGRPGGAAAAADDRLRLVVDDLTGTLIVTATPSQHERIAGLIQRLDSVSPAARRPVRTFVLRNRPVAEVVRVVQDLMHVGALEGEATDRTASTGDGTSGGGAAAQREGGIVAGGSAATVPAPKPPDPSSARAGWSGGAGGSGRSGVSSASPQAGSHQLSLTADEQTNTLIAVGEPRALAQLASLLATIDVRQPQVMLEVLLLSLTDTQTLALGIELERLTRAGDAQVRLSSLFGLSALNAGNTTTVPGSAGGTVTVLSPAEFSILIKALETLNRGRSLSVPKLLVGNNQVGDFRSVLQQPVTTTVTPSSQVTTTTFGGYEQAGTTVSVQPRIAEGDHLGLKYTVTLSAFTGTGSGGLPPPKQENTIKSDVIIPDAYTVALGGIELTTVGEGTTQVPFLGDLPLIGEAFKSRSNNDSRTRFYVFIRAEVMRATSFEDLRYASDRTGGEAGIDDGFPAMEPLLMK